MSCVLLIGQYGRKPISLNLTVDIHMSPDAAVCLHPLIDDIRLLAKGLYFHRRLGRPVVSISVRAGPLVAEGLQGRHLLFAL
jgi:hypothetical protein